MIWTLASGVSIWTVYEILTLWVFANGYIPW
jgi:Delta7-sterol 5-desaturase